MARIAILGSMAILILCLNEASAQSFQALGGEAGGSHNVKITIEVTDAPQPQTDAANQSSADPVAQPVQIVSPVQAEPAVRAAEELPPLPPAEEAATPKALAVYFCRMWRAENFEAMYYCMSARYRTRVEFGKFMALFTSDAEKTGGLDSVVVVAEDPENAAGHLLLLDLKFMKKKMPPRRVTAVFEKTKDGFRLVKSGILPVDFTNL